MDVNWLCIKLNKFVIKDEMRNIPVDMDIWGVDTNTLLFVERDMCQEDDFVLRVVHFQQ